MTIGLSHAEFFLIDLWPGVPTNGTNPASWTTPSATEDFPVGSKRAIYQDTNNGMSILAFLRYEKGTAAAVTVRGICGIDIGEMATGGNWNVVTNDGGEAVLTGPIAIALATMANDEYGWFWVGGVCPVDLIPTLDDGLYGTDASITAGVFMLLADSASFCKFHLAAATDIASFSAFAMAADTTA